MNAISGSMSQFQLDNRTDRRAKQLKRARIVESTTLSTMDCVIRDRSDGGMRLRIASHVATPRYFRLINDTDKQAVNCELVWRKGEELGLKYIPV